MKNFNNLLEWTDKNGSKIKLNISKTTSSTASSNTSSAPSKIKDKYKMILDYHMNHLSSSVKGSKIEHIDDITFLYTETYTDTPNVFNVLCATDQVGLGAGKFVIATYINGNVDERIICNNYDEFIKELSKILNLPPQGSTEYNKLFEELNSSVIDEFKDYENLWEDIEKRFKVIMIVDGEEYAYGTYNSRHRANEIAMQVRDEREIETYVKEV